MANESEFDTIRNWLAATLPEAATPFELTRIGKGQSNLTFLARDQRGAQWLVRRPPFGELLASAHDVGREARVMSALAPTDVPVPKVIAFDDQAADGPLLVMSHINGLVIDSMEKAESLGPPIRARVGPALAETLARVHQVDIETVGLDTLASHRSYAERQLKRWTRQWAESCRRPLPLMEQLADRLWRAKPERERLTLVHGDFYIRNVIIDPQDAEISGVLDWELCTLGDPLADLGTLLAYWPESDEPRGPVFAAPALEHFATRDELVSSYVKESGAPVDDLGFWHALGIWKVAVITEGVLRRSLDDERNRADGAPPGDAVEQLAALADGVARQWQI